MKTSLKTLKSTQLCHLVVKTKVVSGIHRTEKGIPVHLSYFQFLLFVDEARVGDVLWE